MKNLLISFGLNSDLNLKAKSDVRVWQSVDLVVGLLSFWEHTTLMYT